jgi:two-component sensor histidine kinase
LKARAAGSRFQTIRFRLAAAVALALLPVLLLSGFQATAVWRAQVDYQREALASAASRSAATAQAKLDSAVVLLETLAGDTLGVYCAPQLAAAAHRLTGYQLLARYSRSGRVQCASDTAPSAAGQPWFARVRSGGAEPVVERAPAPYASTPAVLIAAPARRVGQFDGAMVAVVSLDALRPDADPSLPAGTEIALADANGRILDAARRDLFGPLRAGWTRDAARDGSVLFSGRDEGGGERVYAGAPLLGNEVFVVLSAPRQGLYSWARLNPVASLLLPLLAWLLAVGAALIVSERVVIRWLVYLERVAGIYAKGRFGVRAVKAASAPLEIRSLAATMDEMADTITRRDASLNDSIAAKDGLLREIHHRVKNNLQVISSLLNMQQRALTDPGGRAAIGDTKQRITALSLIYRALYQSPDLKRVDVRQFLEELIGSLISGESGRGPPVRTELEADTLVIDPDKLAPLALWAVEAISNAQKHAFAARGGMLKVRFKVLGGESVLEVEDDGPGADPEAVGQGVGRTLMTAFARQLRGQTEVARRPEGGLRARLTFPTPEADEEPAQIVGPVPPPRAAPTPSGNQAAA